MEHLLSAEVTHDIVPMIARRMSYIVSSNVCWLSLQELLPACAQQQTSQIRCKWRSSHKSSWALDHDKCLTHNTQQSVKVKLAASLLSDESPFAADAKAPFLQSNDWCMISLQLQAGPQLMATWLAGLI